MTPGSEQPAISGPDSDSWCTPEWLCELLGTFDLDPCSNARSRVRAMFRAFEHQDGLSLDWRAYAQAGASPSVFVNPPYSSPLPWCRKLRAHDGPWVALLKLDPTTKWHAELVAAGAAFAPFRKRIKFDRPDKPPLTANFPSVLVWRHWTPSEALIEHLWITKTGART